MSNYEKIVERIDALEQIVPVHEMELSESMGYVLQQDIVSGSPMPPFNKSAVDGYACRKQDLGRELRVLEVIPAGKVPQYSVGENQCAKIMTGGVVPEGADCVFMIEDAEIIDEQTVTCMNQHTNLNICYLGEDYQPGDLLVKKGSLLRAQHLAVIAGTGQNRIKVAKMPSVGVLVTGSELVVFDRVPEEGKIRDTNSIQLISLLKQMNLRHISYGITRDNKDELSANFKKALSENELVIFTGGAAVGDFDLVPKIIEDEGFEVLWTRTGMKPGNPMICAVKGQTCVFGLSGNPVSSFVQFKYLVMPVIYKLLGADYTPARIRARMKSGYTRNNGSRMGVLPVRITEEGEVEEIRFNGSAHINAIPQADALLEIPVGKTTIEKGEMIYVRPI
ncbi:MAG: molybdopterin molybdotransferase MoeA [Bacteroidales bacterium]